MNVKEWKPLSNSKHSGLDIAPPDGSGSWGEIGEMEPNQGYCREEQWGRQRQKGHPDTDGWPMGDSMEN